jgi:hypothetical protein
VLTALAETRAPLVGVLDRRGRTARARDRLFPGERAVQTEVGHATVPHHQAVLLSSCRIAQKSGGALSASSTVQILLIPMEAALEGPVDEEQPAGRGGGWRQRHSLGGSSVALREETARDQIERQQQRQCGDERGANLVSQRAERVGSSGDLHEVHHTGEDGDDTATQICHSDLEKELPPLGREARARERLGILGTQLIVRGVGRGVSDLPPPIVPIALQKLVDLRMQITSPETGEAEEGGGGGGREAETG